VISLALIELTRMALTGQHSTYLEKCVDSGISLPCDIQRILTTIRTLDERIEVLKANALNQCEQICTLPSAAARTASAEQIATVKEMRDKMDHDHRLLGFLATEKMSFAIQAVNIVRGHMASIQRELTEFDRDLQSKQSLYATPQDEGLPPMMSLDFGLESTNSGLGYGELPGLESSSPSSVIDETQVVTGGRSSGAASSQQRQGSNRRIAEVAGLDPPPQRKTPRIMETSPASGTPNACASRHPSSRTSGMVNSLGLETVENKVPAPAPGDQVAACVSSHDEDGESIEWILARLQRYHSPKDSRREPMWEVKDEDANEGEQNMHMVSLDRVVVLPKGNTVKDGSNLAIGTRVLAVYPRTSAFYLATVLSSAKKYKNGDYGDYILEFEDDFDGDKIPQRTVESSLTLIVFLTGHFVN